eukprot:5545060-Amphidinium_carterae.1
MFVTQCSSSGIKVPKLHTKCKALPLWTLLNYSSKPFNAPPFFLLLVQKGLVQLNPGIQLAKLGSPLAAKPTFRDVKIRKPWNKPVQEVGMYDGFPLYQVVFAWSIPGLTWQWSSSDHSIPW